MKQLHTINAADLAKLLIEKKVELTQQLLKLRIGELKNNQQIKALKREIAQIMTVQRIQLIKK